MASLVEELQRDALSPQARVSDLLRKAKTIAVKLDLPDLAGWVEKELNGYADADMPDYRIVHGTVKGRNPYHGWQPVIFNDAKHEDAFSTQRVAQPVAELEDVISRNKEGELLLPLNSFAKQILMRATGMNLDFGVVVSGSVPVGILNGVRNALLDWSLKLEKAGIRGDGMSFSTEERQKAHEPQVSYNIGTIGTFTGNMGSGSGTFSVQGNIVNSEAKADILRLVDQVEANKAALKLPAAREKELDSAVAGLRGEMRNAQPSAGKVREFLASIRNVAEGTAGSLLAQGILFELGKLMA
jgi:hypothetical protein